LNIEHYLRGGFLQALLFHEGYTSIEGCERITFLIGVSYMKREKMKALKKFFWKRKKKKTNSDESVVRSSIRSKIEW
jgi:hypothetical protein